MTDRSGAAILLEGRPANRGMGEERGNKKQVDAMREEEYLTRNQLDYIMR